MAKAKDLGTLGRGGQSTTLVQHAETTGHDIHPNYVEILGRTWREQLAQSLFLESLHSTMNTEPVNEHQPFPRAYLPFIVYLRDREKF